MAKWPRKRGRSTHAVTIAQNEWFRQANVLAKFASAQDQWWAQELTKNLPLYPRDVLISAMAGRLFERLTVDGKEWYSMAVLQDISADLDLLGGEDLGNLLMRGADLWEPLAPGLAGQVLTANGAGVKPTWQPGGGGGSAYWTAAQPTNALATAAAATKGIIIQPTTEVQVSAVGSTGGSLGNLKFRSYCFDLGTGTTIQAQAAISDEYTMPPTSTGYLVLEFQSPAVLTPDKRWFLCLGRTDGADNYALPIHQTIANTWIEGIPSQRINVSPFWQVPGMVGKAAPAAADVITTAGAQRVHLFLKVAV